MQDKTEWKLNGQGQVFTLPLTDQVSVIKGKIHGATEMPAETDLRCEGIVSKDSNSLACYSMASGAVSHLALKQGRANQTKAQRSSPTVCGGPLCTPSSRVHSRVCYIPCVCFRRTVFHVPALSRHPFTCVSQQIIIWCKLTFERSRSFHFRFLTRKWS